MNNSSDNIVQQVYDSFGVLPPEQRGASPVEEDVNETMDFVDIYQQDVNKMRNESKKRRPRGSSPVV